MPTHRSSARRHRDDRGASAVEYGLLLAGVTLVIVAVVLLLGGSVQGLFDTGCDAIGTASGSGTC